MQNLEHITPSNPIESEILKDFQELQGNEDGLTYQSLRDDIGDDDNAGGYSYTPEQFDAFCLKFNINPNLP